MIQIFNILKLGESLGNDEEKINNVKNMHSKEEIRLDTNELN